jgi:hypothetical protein
MSKKCGYKGKIESTKHSRRNSNLTRIDEKHDGRIQDGRLPKLAFKYKPVGKRNRGRTKKGWKDQCLEDN